MGVVRIKANSAEFAGEYVRITIDPMRGEWFCAGAIIGLVILVFIVNPFFFAGKHINEGYLIVFYLIFICSCGSICCVIPSERTEYIVPRADVLNIKKYPEKRKVTVVLDDERVKYSFVK